MLRLCTTLLTSPDNQGNAQGADISPRHSQKYEEKCGYAENDEPQPQDLEALGLMKLNPCFINVCS